MITLHHLEKSQSIRILWLLEELGVPYEVKLYDRDPNTRLAPAEYKAGAPPGPGGIKGWGPTMPRRNKRLGPHQAPAE